MSFAALRVAVRRQHERDALAAFIATHAPWGYFASAMFSAWETREDAEWLLRRYLRDLAKTIRDHVDFVAGDEVRMGKDIEPEDRVGRHFHLLLASRSRPERLTHDLIAEHWLRLQPRTVRMDVQPFRSGGDAPGYVLKDGLYQVNVACPKILNRCKHRTGCSEAQGSWRDWIEPDLGA